MRRIGLGVLLGLLLAACGTTEPQVGSWVGSVSFSPEDGAEEVPVDANLVVTYEFSVGDEDVSLTDHDATFTVQAQQEAVSGQLNAAQVSGTTALDEEAGTLTFDPDEDLGHGTTYQVTLEGSVTTSDGEEFSGVTGWSFTTVAGVSIGGPGGGDGPVTIDDSGRGTPDVPVDNDAGSQVDVSVVCEDVDGDRADGFGLDPGTADTVTVTDQTVVADLEVVDDGTYTCTITATDGETSASEEVTVVVDSSDDDGDGGEEPGFGLPTDGGDIDVGDDDTGEGTLDVDRDAGHDGDIEFTATCPNDGITLGFDPNPASGGIDQTTISANVDAEVPNGSYDCTVTATDTETGEGDVSTVTVVVSRTVDGLALPEDGRITVTIDDSHEGSAGFIVEQADGLEGQALVVGSCSQEGLVLDSLVEDPDTTDGYTVTVALENPDDGLSNGTYPGACELKASADGSSDATTTVDVVVARTIDDFTLPAANEVTIYVGNDGTGSGTLAIVRDDPVSDTALHYSASCDAGIVPSFTEDLTTGDATLDVEVAGTVANGTYPCDATVTNEGTGESDTTTVEVVVQQFSLADTDLSVSFAAGSSGTSGPLTIERDGTWVFGVDVVVACDGQPVTVDPDSTSLSGSGDSTLTFDVAGQAAGDYECTVTASSEAEGETLGTEEATLGIEVTEPTPDTCTTLESIRYVDGPWTYGAGDMVVIPADDLALGFDESSGCEPPEPGAVDFALEDVTAGGSPGSFFQVQNDGSVYKYNSANPAGPREVLIHATDPNGNTVSSGVLRMNRE